MDINLKLIVPESNFGAVGSQKTLLIPPENIQQIFEFEKEKLSLPNWDLFVPEVNNFFEASTQIQLLNETKTSFLFIPITRLCFLEDPRPFLFTVKSWLLGSPDRRAFLGISSEIPKDAFRVWESVDSIAQFIEAFGFKVNRTEKNLELSCTLDHLEAFFHKAQMPPATVTYILFSDEHSACGITGGIGTYVSELESALPKAQFGFGFLSSTSNVSPVESCGNWIRGNLFFTDAQFLSLSESDRLGRLVEICSFFYPKLSTIEVQDYKGIAIRPLQMRSAGLIKLDLKIKIRCHGTHLYLEQSQKSWMPSEALEPIYYEKYVLEHADEVVFPTHFLKNLYLELGYEIPESKISIQKYPLKLGSFEANPPYREIDTLIFYGKRNAMKGYPFFVEGLLEFFKSSKTSSRIKKIIIIGPPSPGSKEWDRKINQLKNSAQISFFTSNREKIVALLKKHKDSSLVVLPYAGDNMPLAVLDAVSSGCQILSTQKGGIPEMFNESLHGSLLFDFQLPDFKFALERCLELGPFERQNLIQKTHVSTEQIFSTKKNLPLLFSDDSLKVFTNPKLPTVGVIVPCYKTLLPYIEDLILGLNNQSLPPDEIVFVDDASGEEYSKKLEQILLKNLKFPFTLKRLPKNKGLAGARNAAVETMKSQVLVNLDSDDIPRRHFLRNYALYFANNPQCHAVTSFNDAFLDFKDWRLKENTWNCYQPLGDGIVWGLFTNCFGHSNSAYRRETLTRLGGWDESTKAMWEDWALYLKMRSQGLEIGVIPACHFLYRVREKSMSRTYSLYEGHDRLGRVPLELKRFDQHRLRQVIVNFLALEGEYNRPIPRIGRKVVSAVRARFPMAYQALKKTFDRLTNFWRRIR